MFSRDLRFFLAYIITLSNYFVKIFLLMKK